LPAPTSSWTSLSHRPGAFTEKLTVLFLGERTLASFRAFGILPKFSGVAVSDRYVNYYHDGWGNLAGHQACCAHLVRDFEDAAQCFTTDTAVWPTNNISERGVRPLKTQQKISGRLTSEETTQDRLDIRSYLDTARKHSQDVMTVLRRRGRRL
jgi:hypothetical protein